MRILHTSDWHLGRTFHGRVLDDAHAVFADHLVELARTEAVDAVVVSGDVYDRAIPPTDSVRLLDETLRRLSDITRVILTPGNHDSARRLGFASDLLREGLTIRARVADVDRPIVIPGPDGGDGLYVYALPYLDPDAARETLPPLLADRLGEEPTDAARTAPEGARTAIPETAGGHSEKAAGDPPGTASDAPARRLPRSHEAVVSGALRLVAADLVARRARALRDFLPAARRLLTAGQRERVRNEVDRILGLEALIGADGAEQIRDAREHLVSRRRARAGRPKSGGDS